MFILPIGHDKAIYRLPVVTIGVMALCTLIQIWNSATGGGAIALLGHRPVDGPGLSLLTSAFAHGGFLHLAGNVVFLWLTGATLEYRWGVAAWSAFYLLGAFVTALTFSLLHPGSAVPLVGASGAIAAAMGAFVVCLRTARIKFVYLYFIFLVPRYGKFEAPAYVALPLWFALELLQALFLEHDMGGVAYSAHASGFAFGVVVALGLRLSGLEERLRSAVGSDVFDEDGTFLEEAPPPPPRPSAHPSLARPSPAAASPASAEAPRPRSSERPAPPDQLLVQLPDDDGWLDDEEEELPVLDEPDGTGDLDLALAAGDRAAVERQGSVAIERLARADPPAAVALFGRIAASFDAPLPLGDRALAIAAHHAAHQGELQHAMAATRALIVQHPQSRHVPDAMWRTAQLQQKLRGPAIARRTLENLVKAYPQSAAAEKARTALSAARP